MPDDPKVLYWGAALLNMALLAALAALGWRRARARDFAAHKRLMLTAAALVVAFLVSYPIKVAWLGREALDTWPAWHVTVLRFHELCVLTMVVAGGWAITSALRLGLPAAGVPKGLDADTFRRRLARHRFAGRACLLGMLLGFVSALGVFAGML